MNRVHTHRELDKHKRIDSKETIDNASVGISWNTLCFDFLQLTNFTNSSLILLISDCNQLGKCKQQVPPSVIHITYDILKYAKTLYKLQNYLDFMQQSLFIMKCNKSSSMVLQQEFCSMKLTL